MRRHWWVYLFAAAFLVLAPAAHAGCGDAIIADYQDDGEIQGHYSQACYADALANVPEDAKVYSPIVAAIQAAMARDKAAGGTGNGGSGTGTGGVPRTTLEGGRTSPEGSSTEEALPVAPTTSTPPPQSGPLQNAIQSLGPKKADEVPTPVIVLGVLAALLIAVGGGGLIAQRIQKRRAAERGGPSEGPPSPELSG
jgi:hypothetical protein